MKPMSHQPPVAAPQWRNPAPAAFLEQALEGIRVVTRFLEYPTAEAVDQARQCLDVVSEQMSACAGLLSGAAANPDPGLRVTAMKLKEELAHMNEMFREANALYGGWHRLLSAKLGGYTRRGAPAQLRVRRGVALRG